MAQTFFFYDLETSGINAREDRVMQFAGQRTTLTLEPIGEPINLLIRLSPDVLPHPSAILLTGITPQKTLEEGLSEADFLRFFHETIVTAGTVFVGYNSIRFDDEFMRFLHYRNFYDAYDWEWRNDTSRWDILDLVRMARALKPSGITWPFSSDGTPTNRLELLAQLNKLSHYRPHDALCDVEATIAVAKLVRELHRDLFEHLFQVRQKTAVAAIVESQKPFMYTTSHFSSAFLHTSAVVMLAKHDQADSAIVYDLRTDPTTLLALSPPELIQLWRSRSQAEAEPVPLKTIKYNHCPAIVPGVVKDEETLKRLGLSLAAVQKNLVLLEQNRSALEKKVSDVAATMDSERETLQRTRPLPEAELRLYDGFFGSHDKALINRVHTAEPAALNEADFNFQDPRYQELLPRFKARNFPKALSIEESRQWEEYRRRKLLGGNPNRLSEYFSLLASAGKRTHLTADQRFVLEELRLYGESIVPADGEDQQAGADEQ